LYLTHVFFCTQYQKDSDQINKVCPFIESIVENNYNEYGQVVLKEDFHASKWYSAQEYVNLAQKASRAQLIALAISMSTALGLLLYAFYLKKKLVYRIPWRPPKSVTAPMSGGTSVFGDYEYDMRYEAGRVSRMNSGITAMRSKSYDGQSIAYSHSGIVHGDLSYGANSHLQGYIHPDLSNTGQDPPVFGGGGVTPSEGAFA